MTTSLNPWLSDGRGHAALLESEANMISTFILPVSNSHRPYQCTRMPSHSNGRDVAEQRLQRKKQ